jgi:Cdc6-like AAA superfamily ATPase
VTRIERGDEKEDTEGCVPGPIIEVMSIQRASKGDFIARVRALVKEAEHEREGSISIYYPSPDAASWQFSISWNCFIRHTNKTLRTVFMSEEVEERVVGGVRRFMERRDEYETLGMPYRWSCMLSGPPGTGKTSLVKAIAREFHLPIYIFECRYVSPDQLGALVSSIITGRV